jgi:hypothetical protein
LGGGQLTSLGVLWRCLVFAVASHGGRSLPGFWICDVPQEPFAVSIPHFQEISRSELACRFHGLLAERDMAGITSGGGRGAGAKGPDAPEPLVSTHGASGPVVARSLPG